MGHLHLLAPLLQHAPGANTSVRTETFWGLMNGAPRLGAELIGYRTVCPSNTPVRTVFFEDTGGGVYLWGHPGTHSMQRAPKIEKWPGIW